MINTGLAFKLKAHTAILKIFYLLSDNVHQLQHQLEINTEKSPRFFQNTPLIIDLTHFAFKPNHHSKQFQAIWAALQQHGFILLAAQNIPSPLKPIIQESGLIILHASISSNRPKQAIDSSTKLKSQLITQAVRSGQRIYASHKHLIVLASISPGAELMADGHIHVYGVLRGRALAGVSGNKEARIFCQKLDADLVAIAGIYQISEQFSSVQKEATAVQIYLNQHERLIIQTIK